jgi:hypothetical protein
MNTYYKLTKTALTVFFILSSFYLQAQRYITKNGSIYFLSDAPLMKIEGINNKVNSALDIKSEMFVFKVLMKSFVFENALLEEHFNENYAESDKYPVSTFKGKINNIKDINFNKQGNYNVKVEGDLTIHGVTHNIQTDGIFTVYNKGIKGKSEFKIKLADYNIEIPKIVTGKIAEEILIKVNIDLKLLKK